HMVASVITDRVPLRAGVLAKRASDAGGGAGGLRVRGAGWLTLDSWCTSVIRDWLGWRLIPDSAEARLGRTTGTTTPRKISAPRTSHRCVSRTQPPPLPPNPQPRRPAGPTHPPQTRCAPEHIQHTG